LLVAVAVDHINLVVVLGLVVRELVEVLEVLMEQGMALTHPLMEPLILVAVAVVVVDVGD
jgi:hypothetical protein